MQKAVLIMHLITKYILYTNMSKKQQHEHLMCVHTTVLYKSRGNDDHNFYVGPHVRKIVYRILLRNCLLE